MKVSDSDPVDETGAQRAATRRHARAQETRRTIRETAVSLFEERGYDLVRVEEIAAAAGVSHMTVFRHFPTKSALVFHSEYDDQILDLLRERPVTTTIPAMVLGVYRDMIRVWLGSGDELTSAQMRIVRANPVLQGAIWGETVKFQESAVAVMLERFGDAVDAQQMQLLFAAMTSMMMVLLLQWAADEGATDIDAMIEHAVGILRALPS
ncbi:MAG TPA: helix-turn-helix domain-containing protein [Thermomicrobiales bacterium]|jgi:AcrR family transcriptional regulator|nr:helix-turn-helix domain-containing protein [Thermomicrobiales bacterium]